MIRVNVRDGEDVRNALKKFKKLCEREGLIKDMKRHEFYEKPSEKNKRRERKAAKTIQEYNAEKRLTI